MDTNPSSNSEQDKEPQGSPAPMAVQSSEIVAPTDVDVEMLVVPPNTKGKKRSRSDEKPSKDDKDPIIEPASKMILLKNSDMNVRYESVTKELLTAQKLNKRLARECEDLKSEKAAVQNLLISTQHQMHTLSEAHAKLTRLHTTLLSQPNQPGSSSENDELQNISAAPVSLTGEEVMRLTMDFTNQAQELQDTKEQLAQHERELSTLKTEINTAARQELVNALATRVMELGEARSLLEQREKDFEEEKQRNNKAIEELSSNLASQHATLQTTQDTLQKRTTELDLLKKEHMDSGAPAMNAEDESLKTRLNQCQDELAQCQNELAQCQNELAQCQNELAQCQNELAQCQNELAQCQNELAQCQNELAQCQGKLVQCQGELARTTESFEEAGEKNLTLASEKDDLADELEEVKSEKNDLTGELERLKIRFEKYQKEKQQELNELAEAKNAVKVLTEDLEAKKAEQNETSRLYSTLQEQNSENLDTINKLRDNVADQKNALEEKESALKSLQLTDEIRIQELRDELDDTKADLSHFKEQSSLVNTAKVTQAGELDKLRKEGRKLTRELADATASRQTLALEQKELQARVDKLMGELKEKTASAKNTEERLKLKEKLETSRNERHQKDLQTINSLRDEVQKMKNTISDNINAKATIARRHEDEAQELEKQLAQAKAALENQTKQQAELVSKHNAELQEQRSQIVSEYSIKHEELKGLRQEVESQKTKIKNLEESAGEASSQIRELESQKKIFEQRVGGEWVERSRLETTKKALAEQEKKVAALQEQLGNLSKAQTTNISAIQIERDRLLAEVESLKQKISATPSTSQPSDQKSSQEIQKLKDNIESLNKRISDYRAEIKKLKAQTSEPSAEPDETVARLFGMTIRGSRRTLSRVNVEAASHKALRKYGLGGSIEDTTDPAYVADSEKDETDSSYLIGQKPKRKSPYLTTKGVLSGHTSKKKKPKVDGNDDVQSESDRKPKPKAEDSGAGSSDGEDVYSDQDVESKTGQTRDIYARKGIRRKWTEEEQVNQSNRLVRTQLREMLNVPRNIDAPRRPGIEEKDISRLQGFLDNPELGPGLRCTYLDLSGRTAQELKESDWNQMFILNLAQECQDIAETSPNRKRFAPLKWHEVARERVYRILLSVAKSIPKTGETKKQTLTRLLQEYAATLDNAKNTFSRHQKFQVRRKVAATMADVCHALVDEDGESFWLWVLHVLNRAGVEFMSDEEDITVLDESGPSSSTMLTAAKQVLHLKWRAPYFTRLFIFIDTTTGVEEVLFKRIGRASMRRIRGKKDTTWPAPAGRPKSFYAPVFIAKLTPPQVAALRLDETKFVLRDFEGYKDD